MCTQPAEDVKQAQQKLQHKKADANILSHVVLAAVKDVDAYQGHDGNDARTKNERYGEQ